MSASDCGNDFLGIGCLSEGRWIAIVFVEETVNGRIPAGDLKGET
jgi:hypothetical protein